MSIPVKLWNLGEQQIVRITHSPKILKLLEITLILGILDGLQARYMPIGSLGEDEAIAYQVVFMAVAVGASYYCLEDAHSSKLRNLSNLVLSIPVATLADNISIDVQTLRPYLLVIPQNGYDWRNNVFGSTFLSSVARWVNHPFLVSGLIYGYVTAIGIFVVYLVVQRFWPRVS